MSAPPALTPNSGAPAPSPAPSTVSTATAGAAADNAENIWQQMLAKATTKSKEEDSTLIVLGDKKNGKSYVLKKFKDRVLNPKSQEYLLDYSYVNVKNVHDDDPDETRAYMNVWEIDSVEQAGGILPIILRTQGLKNTVYMVTLDLSTPWNIQDRLDKWMALLVKAHQSVFSTLPVAEQEAMKLKVSQYNQLFVDASIKAEEKQADKQASSAEPADIKINPDIPPINLGVPLIIAGCKGDSLAQACASQNGVGDRFEYVTRHLRKFALEYGASLMFTSSVGQSGVGVDILQEYVYHRLYNFELVHASKPVGSETDYGIHVFSGYDSLDLINSIQPAKASWKEDAQFSDVFRDPAQAKQQAAQRHDPEVKADDNEVFFRTLKFTMERGAPTRVRHKINVDGPVAGPSTSTTRTSDAPLPQAETRDSRASVGSSSGAPVVVTPPGGAAGAPAAAAAAAGGAPGAPRQEQKAVRDFFRSLLTTTNTGAAKPSPAQVRDALHQIKSEKPAQ